MRPRGAVSNTSRTWFWVARACSSLESMTWRYQSRVNMAANSEKPITPTIAMRRRDESEITAKV